VKTEQRFDLFSESYKKVYTKDQIMLTKEITINGTDYRLTLTDQLVNQVNNLKSLYSAAYEDPESFEQVSSEISTAINEIAAQADPPVMDDDLDKFIQEIIKTVDEKEEEMKEELAGKPTKPKKEPEPKSKAKSKK
jgi:hypothetical protein